MNYQPPELQRWEAFPVPKHTDHVKVDEVLGKILFTVRRNGLTWQFVRDAAKRWHVTRFKGGKIVGTLSLDEHEQLPRALQSVVNAKLNV